MNQEEIRKFVPSDNTDNIGECLKALTKARVKDLIKPPQIKDALVYRYATLDTHPMFLRPEERESHVKSFENITVSEAVDCIAKNLGGNFLRPYLKYLNVGAEKFENFNWPKDVQHHDPDPIDVFRTDEDDRLPYEDPDDFIEPEYFTEEDEGDIIYSANSDLPEKSDNFTAAYIEAPALPLPNKASQRKEPLFKALEYDLTAHLMDSLLANLSWIVI